MDVTQGRGRDIEQPSEKEGVVRADPKSTRGRRPYRKPAFRFERVFETMALSCGKTVITQFQCQSSQKTS
jgi:hypothetical protein